MPRWLWLLALVTLGTALVFAFDFTPWVRGGYGWRWEYLPVPLVRGLPLALALIGYVMGGVMLLKHTSRPVYTLLWGILGVVMLSLAAGYARDGDVLYALFTRTASLTASGEWWGGAMVEWANGGWRDWVGVMAQLGERTSNMATSPPGIPLIYGAAASVLNTSPAAVSSLYATLLPYQCHNYEFLTFTPAVWASAWVGMLSPLWAGLAVIPLYRITRRTYPMSAARLIVLWWALVPGLLSFVTSSSTVFPTIALVIFDLLQMGLHGTGTGDTVDHVDHTGKTTGKIQLAPTRHAALNPRSLCCAGLIYGLGLFGNFIFLPLAALYGIYTLLHYGRVARHHGARWWQPLLVGAWFGLGACVVWVIWYALTGQTFFQMLGQSLNTHLDLERPYGYWVWMHVWDWAIWTGLVFVLLALTTLRLDSAVFVDMRSNKSKLSVLISHTLLLTILALTLSGTTRGESGRIWLVLAPFALIAAAGFGQQFGQLRHWLALTIIQACFTLVLVMTIEAFPASDLTPPPAPPQVTVSRPTQALFSSPTGAAFRLIGWDAEPNERELILQLQWQGVVTPHTYQWFGAVFVSPSGATYPTEAWQPSAGTSATRFPTTCWQPDMLIGDVARLPLPADAESGDWYVSLAVFGEPSPHQPDGRFTVTLPDGTQDVQIGLGAINIP